MTISVGAPVKAATDNAAFISKTASSGNSVTGIVELNNGSSGDTTSNLQQTLSDNTPKTSIGQSIVASGTITTDTDKFYQLVRVQGDAGAQTASATPFGTSGGWKDGAVFRIVGLSDSDTLTIEHNDIAKGFILNGNITLIKYQILTVVYDSTLDRFIELSRNL